MATDGQHCSFVLLSEFDIDLGPKLTYQFPQPLGMNEGLLANLMLPDGAERQLEDWTIFFLNQTSFNTIAPVLALEKPEQNRLSVATMDEGKPELLYVMNLVRTKHDKTVKRGAVVKAMAICTRHPFIHIFKPVLLMALDEYYNDPSQDCLARLFDAVNAMDLSGAPSFSRHEKLILRGSDRTNLFAEKYTAQPRPGASETGPSDTLHVPGGHPNGGLANKAGSSTSLAPKSHRSTLSWDSRASTEEGIVLGTKPRDRAGTVNDLQALPPSIARAPSPRGDSFSLDGSAVWVDGDTTAEATPQPSTGHEAPLVRRDTTGRGRRSTDASSSSEGRKEDYFGANGVSMHAFRGSTPNLPSTKDTRSFHTTIAYKGHQIPIRMPIDTFPEEVGDYSLIEFMVTFTSATAHIQGALHPHLHTNGNMTPPIIVLFNALITGKRVIFLGHGRPAGQVSKHVLAACALASGCGTVLRGFIERAFPYANLLNKEEWETVPAFIAGVTNPIFESFDSWDVLCDISNGRIAVSKDIVSRYPVTATALSTHTGLLSRTGTLKSESSAADEEMGRMSTNAQKGDFNPKTDNSDNLFIEDIIYTIGQHYGENLIRARFQEYVLRFVRLASRYEEEIRQGQTSIGYPSTSYSDGRLGSGIVFSDDVSGQRELVMNAARIEGWMKTPMYINYQVDFNKSLSTTELDGFDVAHQIWRFRHARNMLDGEVELILRTIASKIRTYSATVELLSYMSTHQQNLLPLSFGLFHQSETVRELTVDIFNEFRQYPIGVHFLHTLNYFQRYAFVRQASQREARVARMLQQLNPESYDSRALPDRSETSLVQ